MCSLVVYKEWLAEDAMNTGLSQCGGISPVSAQSVRNVRMLR